LSFRKEKACLIDFMEMKLKGRISNDGKKNLGDF
jgi:hypothetical protein